MDRKQALRQNISELLKYIRCRDSLSQQEASSILLFPRTTYIRLENAQKDLTFSEWLRVRESFNITTQELENGYLNTAEDECDKFSLPQMYNDNRFTKGRLLYLLVAFFKSELGQEHFEQFCAKERVPSSYFTNVSNTININFSLRLYQELTLQGKLRTKEQLQKFAALSLNMAPHHGENLQVYNQNSGIKRLSLLIPNMPFFEENHTYTLEDYNPNFREVTVSFKPNDHIDKKSYSSDRILGEFMREWTNTYFESFAGVPLYTELKENFFKTGGKSVYTYRELQ